MAYFAFPYRVLFHDSMAYGSHHFLANFTFQCAAREHLLFGEIPRHVPLSERIFDEYLFLTQEGYARTLSSAPVGTRVCVLLTIDEPTRTSVRFCFRVIGANGLPVCCGYQTVVCLSKKTREIVPAPEALRSVESSLRERLAHPSFHTRVATGSLAGVFDDEELRIGKQLACADVPDTFPRIILRADELDPPPDLSGGPILLLPALNRRPFPLLRDIRSLSPEYARQIHAMDQITGDLLGASLQEFIRADENEHADTLRHHEGLAQVASYAFGIFTADYLMRMGLRPSAVLGHGMGELTALAAAGGLDYIVGAEINCRRAIALHACERTGGILTLRADPERVHLLLKILSPAALYLSVLDHSSQTTVSGTHDDLERLSCLSRQLGIPATPLSSRYPIHSPLMDPARLELAWRLGHLRTGLPSVPVYSAISQGWYVQNTDLGCALSNHLVEPVHFSKAIERLASLGATQFIDCGDGNLLQAISLGPVHKRSDFSTWSVMSCSAPLSKNLAMIVEQVQQHGPENNSSSAPVVKFLRDSDEDSSCIVNSKNAPSVGNRLERQVGSGIEPIAIVGLGCVMPGAADPGQLWSNIEAGVSAIEDGARLSSIDAPEFLGKPGTPDKTYSLLRGVLRSDTLSTPLFDADVVNWSLAQKMLAASLTQCCADFPAHRFRRTQMIVGFTADGVVESDEELLQRKLDEIAAHLGIEELLLKKVIAGVTNRDPALLGTRSADKSFCSVANAVLGEGVQVLTVDAACASSLYAIALALAALRDGICDLAFAGGVFAPGPVNNCLFAQFRGLSATGSRPFDATADGVVFSPGAGVLALKRLSDAVSSGDRIHAVIREIGLSSDGRCASVIEPKVAGQQLAMKRALQRSGIDPLTVQFLEAHATSTAVGDEVELKAIGQVYNSRARQEPIYLGSLKAQIGHTGWAAGIASVIKVCAALAAETIPAQPNIGCLTPALNGWGHVSVPTTAKKWRRTGTPRRAGVNSFGFGGANAHLVLEEFDQTPCGVTAPICEVTAPIKGKNMPLCVVGFAGLFPSGFPHSPNSQVDDCSLVLPRHIRLLPDLVEQMDRSQRLAIIAAWLTLHHMGAGWEKFKTQIAVVVGFDGRTGKSSQVIGRIYADLIRRRIRERLVQNGPESDEGKRAFEATEAGILSALRCGTASNAYTLQCLMPNVIAGRVANLFDLGGPNFVVSAGALTFWRALDAAQQILRHQHCELVLAGGISGVIGGPEASLLDGNDRRLAEAAVMLALTTKERAQAFDLKVLAQIELHPEVRNHDEFFESGRTGTPHLAGAEGGFELLQAVERCSRLDQTVLVGSPGKSKLFASIQSSNFESKREALLPLIPTDIHLTTPRWRQLLDQTPPKFEVRQKRILALVDSSFVGDVLSFVTKLLCPEGANIRFATTVPLADDYSAISVLRTISAADFDLILIAKDLVSTPEHAQWDGTTGGERLLDLAFVVTRHLYEAIASGKIMLATLLTSAGTSEFIHPMTGLFAGFVKALAREMPTANCRALATNTSLDEQLFIRMMRELGRRPGQPWELFYQDGRMGQFVLEQFDPPSLRAGRTLTKGSVVVASGGGRGVTACLCARVLESAHCHVVLLGRTEPGSVELPLIQWDDDRFDDYEAEFYRQEASLTPRARPAELRERFRQLSEARAVARTISQLRAAGHSVEYRRLDITDAKAVEALLTEILHVHGRLDLIIHGAGQQRSRRTNKKSLAEFRAIVQVKVGGVRNILGAITRLLPDQMPDFHLLTSAFSFFGNDGQADYGAANEALNRLSVALTKSTIRSTAIAWLGWAEVGMTRGTEYAALARKRGLRPLRASEGQDIFQAILEGATSPPDTVLLSPGEMAFYDVNCLPSGKTREVAEWQLNPRRQKFLANHLVNGVPTLPGTFEVDFAVRSATALRPELTVMSVEDVRFFRFVKVPMPVALALRSTAQIISESDEYIIVRVELRSDFTHPSGRVLQWNLLHFSGYVRLVKSHQHLPNVELTQKDVKGETLPDPYIDQRAPVQLGAGYDCLRDVRITSDHRVGRFALKSDLLLSELEGFTTPALLLDALCRFAMIHKDSDGTLPVFTPISCKRLLLRTGINDCKLQQHGAPIHLRAQNPISEGGFIRSRRAEAFSSDGDCLLIVEELMAKRMGTVENSKIGH